LSSKEVRELKRGDIISYRLAGAGGYGDPRQRSPDAVRADVIDGFISRATAVNVYGTTVE
jgi:N-methylhydantoinase B